MPQHPTAPRPPPAPRPAAGDGQAPPRPPSNGRPAPWPPADRPWPDPRPTGPGPHPFPSDCSAPPSGSTDLTVSAPQPPKKAGELTLPKVLAGAGAAATSAVLGSFFGADGTVY